MTTQGDVVAAVLAERRRQDAKWGEQNHTDEWWLAVLMEEVGEVAQSVLQDEFGGGRPGHTAEEIEQVAAVAVAWLECIHRRFA
jgi:NTP pyrophosphatase (non-canonical NTP hydrolase)